MATTQYIGARYVPVFADPAEWDNTRTYERLTIVLHEGNSFTSRQNVPAGIDINNTNFWLCTGNYNAQIEAYRRDVANYAKQVNAVSAALNAEVDRATAAENDLSASIAEESDRAQKAEAEIAKTMISETLRFKIKTRDAQDHSYAYADAPNPAWDSVQGCCYTKNGRFAITTAPGLVYYRQNSTTYLNKSVIKEFNADGTLYRQSQPIECGHANSITYDETTNELLIANNYKLAGDSAETRIESNLVTRVDYNTFGKITDFAVNELGSVCNAISFDKKSKKLMAFNTDTFSAIYLNTKTYSAEGSVLTISGYEQFYNDTVVPFDSSRRQSAVLYGDKIVCSTYMPNLFLFFDISDLSKIEKYVACEDMYACEAEDFEIDSDGNIIIGFHKRFYNRTQTMEYVSNMYSIEESNIYTNYYNLDWADGTAVSSQRYIDVNPSTKNVIQNGSVSCPCKTVMQAYLEWLKCDSKQIAIRIAANATGIVKAVRMGYSDVYIDDNSGGNVVFNNNMRLVAGRFNLDGLTFETQTDKDAIPFPFSTTQGNPSASQSTVNFYECTQNTTDATFGVSNCVYINTKTAFSITQHNRNITNA